MSDHDDARRAVMRTLRSETLPNIDFQIHSFHVTTAGLREVGLAVCEGRIGVRFERDSRQIARYNSDGDTIAIPFTHARDAIDKAQIIHEATHALADIIRANWMCIQTSEAAAHIAQALYAIAFLGESPRQLHGTGNDDRVFETAWNAAIGIRNRQPGIYGLMEAVRTAVAGHSRYGQRDQTTPVGFNGLSRPATRTCTPT
jgi:hypothetical protein